MPRVLAMILTLALAAPAGAQEDGVFVDPDYGAGKEYDIPHETARRDAGGGVDAVGSASRGSSPRFGSGVTSTSPTGDLGRDSDSSIPGAGESRERPSPRDEKEVAGQGLGWSPGPWLISLGLLAGAISLGVALRRGLRSS